MLLLQDMPCIPLKNSDVGPVTVIKSISSLLDDYLAFSIDFAEKSLFFALASNCSSQSRRDFFVEYCSCDVSHSVFTFFLMSEF